MERLLVATFAVVVLAITATEAGTRTQPQLIGATKCTWGPSFWCNDLRQSAKCGATKFCIKKDWVHRVYPVDDDDVCKICKDMVGQARDQLMSNETQEELKEVFEGSCALIPIKVVAKECMVLADEFVPELVETLASEMNPDTVCAVAGLCNSKRIDKLLAKHKAQLTAAASAPVSKTDCEICKEETKKLSTKIHEADKDLVLDKMLEVCGYMSSYSDACRAMVIDHFEDIYDVLIHLDDGLCDLAGMCPSNKHVLAEIASSTASDVQCEFCEKVIQHWVDTWTSNTTEEEFKQVLDALCHKMKTQEKVDRCLHIVDDYYIPWFNYLAHELNPKVVCTMFGLCPGGDGLVTLSPETSISLLFPPRPKIEMAHDPANTGRLLGGYFAPQTAVIMDKPGCVICEFVISELKQIIGQNKTEEEIEAKLEKVCTYMPTSVQDQCTHLVDTYGKAIIELFARDVDPDEMCTIMQLCGKSHDHLLNKLPEDNPVAEIKKKDDNCALCQYAMDTLFSILQDKDDRDEIRNVLETLCDIMPKSLEDKCEAYVAKYTDAIIEFIIKDFTPDEVCTALQMCEAKAPVPTATTTAAPSSNVPDLSLKDSKCVLCEYVMTMVDSMLTNKTNEEEIKAAMEHVCHMIPKSISGQCVKFVDQYTDIIIDFLTHDITPDQVCQQLGLCKAEETNAEQFQMLDTVNRLANDVNQGDDRPYCTLCEYAIGEVDKLLEDKTNEKEIKSVLDRICYELSTPIQKECVNMVNQYTDEIIQMFVKGFTPKQVCAEIGLCNSRRLPHRFEVASNDARLLTNEISPATTKPVVKAKGGPLCVICEFAINILESQLITNRTLDMVERAVQMICSKLPSTVDEECEAFVDKYGDEIIRIIIEAEANPDEICSAMGACTTLASTATSPKMFDASAVGGHKCAFGPAFWCQSIVHARACGTVKHCQDNVWNN